MLKLRLDLEHAIFLFFAGAVGGAINAVAGGRKLRRVPSAVIYRCVAGSSERNQHAGAMGGYYGEWRRLSPAIGYPPTGDDSTHRYQHYWRRRRRYPADQNAGADFLQGSALAVVGRHVAFYVQQACGWACIRRNVG